MLSRQASALFWIGRYQERTEYLARFLQVKYFSTMDSSNTDYKDFALRSILFLSTGNPSSEKLIEGNVLWEVCLNKESETSLITYINNIRENTKGVRNLVSKEIWEIINKNYHFVNNYSVNHLKTRGLYEFTHELQENASSFQAKLDSTLLHDDVWSFIKLGIYTERAYQITRILINTLIDITALKGKNENHVIENNQWVLTLNVLEALDMSRKIFNSNVYQDNTCEFLITHLDFPRSIACSLENCNKLIKKIKHGTETHQLDRNSLIYKTAKLSASVKYLDYKELDMDLIDYLNKTLIDITKLNDSIHDGFFQSNQ